MKTAMINSPNSGCIDVNPVGRVIFQVRWLLAYALLLLGAVPVLADCPGDPDFTKKTVGQLLVCLDDEPCIVRVNASNELEQRIPKLTIDDWGLVGGVLRDSTSLEQRRRVEKLIATFLIDQNNAPSAKAAWQLVDVGVYWPDGPTKTKFAFGQFHGQVDGKSQVLTGLFAQSIIFRNRIVVGDVGGALKRLTKMTDFVNELSPDDFKSLNLMDSNNVKIDRKAVLKAIGDAKGLTKKSEYELLENMGDFPVPYLPKGVRVAAAGLVDLGKTVAMNLQTVVTAGTLEYAWSDAELAYGAPPPGFVSYGPMFDMQVEQDLLVSGAISFSIQYGDSSGNAYGITDPSRLAIVRISNGQYQFVSGFNDLGQHTITGVYRVDSLSHGLDQFGEFMLVAPSYPGAGGIQFAQAGHRAVIVYGDDVPLPAGP